MRYAPLNLNVEPWDQLPAEHVASELDFGYFDLSQVADSIADEIDTADLPWNYNLDSFNKPSGAH
jgi:hypothetical protein